MIAMRVNCSECGSTGPVVTIGPGRSNGWDLCEACVRKALALVAAPVSGSGGLETKVEKKIAALAELHIEPRTRTVTCIAQVTSKGVEVVVSGMPRVVDPSLLTRDPFPGEQVCVELDAFNQITRVSPADD
jgi:hypothetical protein